MTFSISGQRIGRIVPLFVVAAIGLSGCGTGGSGSDAGPAEISASQKGLYEEAVAAGGRANLFIGSSGDERTDQLIERFNETFPDVTVEYVSGTGNEVTERLLTEKRSGLDNADALLVAGMNAYRNVAEEGYIADFAPEDAALFTQDKSSYIENAAYSFARIYNGVCYNANNVSETEAELLKTYEGWTDPVWKGRAAIVNANGFGYRFGLSHWVYQDPELGEEWLKKLAALEPTVFNNASIASPQVIAGEYDVLFNSVTQYGAWAHRDGVPLKCTTGEYAPYYPSAAGLVEGAPNAAAGKLFLNWLFSENGQEAVQETWSYTAARDGFNTPVIEADWWKLPDDQRPTDEEIVSKNYSQLVNTFNIEFGPEKG